ncbi:hypothetical protein [Gynuella sunshinyii]|nr:hypothetical protein [Gynuella sunshinyii]
MAVRLVEVVLLEGSVIEITIDVSRLNQIAAVPDVAFCVLIPEIGLVMGAIAFVVWMVTLEIVKLGINTFDEGAIEIILRHAQGNLRLCCNLCYGSLAETCRENKMTVTIRHVNNVLIQPHWSSHE